jgi:hypothetical protein
MLDALASINCICVTRVAKRREEFHMEKPLPLLDADFALAGFADFASPISRSRGSPKKQGATRRKIVCAELDKCQGAVS